MVRALIGVGLALWVMCDAAEAAETVRISMGAATDRVEVTGRQLTMGADSEEGPFTRVPGDRGVVQEHGGSVALEGVAFVGPSIRFRAAGGEPGRSAPVRANGFDVRGDVVVRSVKGHLELINVIPLEEYLMAVLGGEMPVGFPPEALKAQAVAARTYAVHKKLDALDAPYHLGSSVLHQVYQGLNREDPRTRAAVDATRGEILTYQLAPIEAYFHSSCGGRTESGLAALNRDLPYLQSVDCPCAKLPQSHWSLRLPRRDLLGAFHESSGLTVVSRSATGRARRVLVGRRSLDAVQFRQKVGYDRVKSLSFEVSPEGKDAFLLSGRGYGHGAGLCQWGAKVFADEGMAYRQILSHYYPGTELQRLY